MSRLLYQSKYALSVIALFVSRFIISIFKYSRRINPYSVVNYHGKDYRVDPAIYSDKENNKVYRIREIGKPLNYEFVYPETLKLKKTPKNLINNSMYFLTIYCSNWIYLDASCMADGCSIMSSYFKIVA